MRYALIRDGIVDNIILWDGSDDWSPADGIIAVQCPDHVSIGWRLSGSGDWVPPPPESGDSHD